MPHLDNFHKVDWFQRPSTSNVSQEPLLYLEFNKPNKQNVYESNLFENFNISQSENKC